MPYGCQSDSRSELDRLMEQYGSSLLRMSALYLKDASLAQDAVQETFLKAYRHLQDYRGESSELLLFFNGWSMDERAVAHLASGGLDVQPLWDSTAPDTAFFAELSRYRKIHLAAWSLGVFTAAQLLAGPAIEFASATAFNGTLRPVDAAFGIAPEIFRGTAEHWGEERARSRFFQRVAGGRAELEAVPLRCRTPEEQLREQTLLYLRQ